MLLDHQRTEVTGQTDTQNLETHRDIFLPEAEAAGATN